MEASRKVCVLARYHNGELQNKYRQYLHMQTGSSISADRSLTELCVQLVYRDANKTAVHRQLLAIAPWWLVAVQVVNPALSMLKDGNLYKLVM